MRKITLSVLCLFSYCGFAGAQILGGDERLACEAILCLSSGVQPGECGPSLARYFGINLEFWSDTLTARHNFLNLCPTAHDTSSADMPQIIDHIVDGAGRCDAAYLNTHNLRVIQKKVCSSGPWGECHIETITVISEYKPSYCSAYADSRYTYKLDVTYVGEPLNGGHWVDG